MGAGEWTTAESFRLKDLSAFLTKLDSYRENLGRLSGRMNGTFDALALIDRALKDAVPPDVLKMTPVTKAG
jgi:hypothetical protein